MFSAIFLRRLLHQTPPQSAARGGSSLYASSLLERFHSSAAANSSEALVEEDQKDHGKPRGNWVTLPPFTPTVDGASLGRDIAARREKSSAGGGTEASSATSMTAFKWVLRCCPELPKSVVQKLFRLRQVRRETTVLEEDSDHGIQVEKQKLKRVTAKDSMNLGDRIFLPISVKEVPLPSPSPSPTAKRERSCNEEELNFIQSLVFYRDSSIIVINKPPGMPVQGGIGVKRSLDELAASYLRFDYSEPPRLVHRLDRDCSGILMMGRTQTSTTVLHSIFREKTLGLPKEGVKNKNRILQRRYWALVIGSPKRTKGLISAPLGKVVVDDGKSDRVTIIDSSEIKSSQHAVTEFRVIGSPCHGFTWLELSPLTGRKHQLRVHCAEILGTPIVGDYKYGWQAHKTWETFYSDAENNLHETRTKGKALPLGLDMESGSISEKKPRLHLHCKQMVLPNVNEALRNAKSSSNYDLSELKSLELDAPLPPYMQRSWDILNA